MQGLIGKFTQHVRPCTVQTPSLWRINNISYNHIIPSLHNTIATKCRSPHLKRWYSTNAVRNTARKTDYIEGATTGDEYLTITWGNSNDSTDRYPLVFLRDCCQCSECYNQHTKSRTMLFSDLDVEVRLLTSIKFTGDEVVIDWSDGHVSTFGFDWLKERSFKPEKIEARHVYYGEKKEIWNNELLVQIPRYSFEKVLSDKSVLLRWLTDLDRYGLTYLEDVQTNDKQLTRISQVVAPIRHTNYGGTFSVKSRVLPNNLAYTGVALGFHTDLSYYGYSPQIIFLQCVKQAECEGGANVFADGHYIAQHMKAHHPREHHILTTTPVDFYDIGEEESTDGRMNKFHLAYRRPTISIDENENEYNAIYFNHHVRAYISNLPVDRIKPLYKAFKLFNDLAEQHKVQHKMNAGEMVVFDNTRVLHGRTSFKLIEGGRHLEGIFMDWDDVRSRIRVLKE